ncbi:MAG: hypothetical protein GPOALKHO_001648 [Sodalis sp.]|uniref:hypothetical protein n=1 Tax=Sodalis sp. (in: enterobacteria) TaxID=1898979 RepID=UPI003873C233|nr:MAG: hypothetical protein GPOALKHO_001648 [Sodalis sp.]
MLFSETLVMGVTVAATVWTDNLAVGVGGVVLATILFAHRVAHVINAERKKAGRRDSSNDLILISLSNSRMVRISATVIVV